MHILTPPTGYKFETLCLLPDTWDATSREYIEGREDQIVNNSAQYCSVVQTGIGNSSLIIGGEVDAGTLTFPPPSPAIREPKLTPLPSLGLQTHPPNPTNKLGRAQNLPRPLLPPRPPSIRAQTPKILAPILPPRCPQDHRRLPRPRRSFTAIRRARNCQDPGDREEEGRVGWECCCEFWGGGVGFLEGGC
jgi:hypothetical protein